MDGKDFDRLTRAMQGSGSRRQVVQLLGGGLVGSLLGVATIRGTEAAYGRRCTRFVLSGGRSRDADILVDDYIVVKLNGNRLSVRQNGVPQGTTAGPRDPVRFYARRGDVLRIQAFDTVKPRRYLGRLYLHCIEGSEGSQEIFASQLPFDKTLPDSKWRAEEFFDESYRI
jgi:hypothetical protein